MIGLGPGGGGGALLSVGSKPLPLPADPLEESEEVDEVGEASTRWLGPGAVGATRAPTAWALTGGLVLGRIGV
jgi:hypothetical protein